MEPVVGIAEYEAVQRPFRDRDRDDSGALPTIDAFGADLNHVWTNLLTNAADAIDGSGDIRIRTRPDGAGSVAVEIEDTGRGIPDAILRRVFDPFFTTKPPGQRTGMGPATGFTIVQEKHHGTLTVQSRPGRTIFTVRLPVRRVAPGN